MFGVHPGPVEYRLGVLVGLLSAGLYLISRSHNVRKDKKMLEKEVIKSALLNVGPLIYPRWVGPKHFEEA